MPFEWLALVALFSYAVRDPFAGPVQFYLNGIGLGVLWFVPDLIGIVCIVALLAIDIREFRSFKFLFILLAIFYYMLLGYVSIGSVASSFSGFKALLPLFVGLMLTRRALQRRFVQLALMALLFFAVGGLWWSSISDLPWSTLNFDSGFGDARQFKQTIWGYGGYRPFGFAADQHSAGSSVVFFLALIGVGQRRLSFYMLSLLAGIGIYISTSRTSLLALVVLVIFRFTLDYFEKRNRPRLTELVTACVPFFVLLAPICIMWFAQSYSINEIPSELISVWVRGYEVFLQPFNLMPIFAPNAWLFGFGLGGVGFPLRLSNYASYEFAAIIDNFLLFSYYSFGIPFLLFYVAMCVRNCSETDFYKRILFCMTLIFGQFILGWANGMFMLVFGYAASSSFLRGRSLLSPSLARVHH